MSEQIVAKYIRLSLDEAHSGSLSIQSQRALLDRYLADSDMDAGEVLEFVDNGCTGTDYERPAIQELLALVRAGRVACVLVKDFTRLGRMAIETGYLIERVFPLFRVRLISVSDAFDSLDHPGDTGGTEVAFKLLMGECYSRDLSMKVRSAKREQALRGEAVSKNCAFGYRLDEKRKMTVDPEAAQTVRIIFDLYAAGRGVSRIAQRLYEENRPTPAAYKGRRRTAAARPGLSCVWEYGVLRSILRDERYLGIYIAGKTRSRGVGHPGSEPVPQNDWIRIPDHHPPIIPRELFVAVQMRIGCKEEPPRRRERSTTERDAAETTSPLKGKAVCGNCGHVMVLSDTKNAAFHCRFTRSAAGAACHRLKIRKSDLEEAVLERVRRHARMILEAGLCSGGVRAARSPAVMDYAARMERLRDEKRRLYEDLVTGAVSREAYKEYKAAADAELERMAPIYEAILAENQSNLPDAACIEAAKTALQDGALTPKQVDLLIDRVLVFPDQPIEISWKLSGFSGATS